jgi:L-ascorbate metabolism protein UlaG (beta-lactamase superfamily)
MLIILAIVILLSIPFILGWLFSAPAYRGPVSDHFDGRRFTNPGNVPAKGMAELVKWMRNRERGQWQEIYDASPGPRPPVHVAGDSIRVTFVNHSTFLIQCDGLNILTDPVWSGRASPVNWAGPRRMRPPGIRFEDLPGIDIILLSHNHYDHLDIKTLKKLHEQFRPAVYCPLGVGKYLRNNGIDMVTEMDWWDERPIAEDLQLICTPAQHFSGRGMFDRDRTLWAGFAIKSSAGTVYFAGDSGYGDFFREIGRRAGPVILSLLPIGAYKPQWFMAPIHTSPEDAVRIHLEMGSQMSVGTHFGTFPLADDGMDDAVKDLEAALGKFNVPPGEFVAMEEGGSLLVPLVPPEPIPLP